MAVLLRKLRVRAIDPAEMRLFRRSRSACRRYDVQLSADKGCISDGLHRPSQWPPSTERSTSCQGVRDGRSPGRSSSNWRSFGTYRSRAHDKDVGREEDGLFANCFGVGSADVVVVACRDVTSPDQLTQTEFDFVGGRRHTLQYTPRQPPQPVPAPSPASCHRRPLLPGTPCINGNPKQTMLGHCVKPVRACSPARSKHSNE